MNHELRVKDYERVIYSHELGESWSEKVRVEENQTLRWLLVCVDKVPREINLEISLVGRKSHHEFMTVYLGRGRSETKMNVTFIHDAPETYGRITAKAALFDQAKLILRGVLEVTPRAKASDTYFLAKSLLMSPRSRAEIYPYLEIKNDNVRASHGVGVGRPDPRQIFYLRSRGLVQEEAERIILSGFFRDIYENSPLKYAEGFSKGLVFPLILDS